MLLAGPSGQISLSPRETQLLEVFFRNPNQALTRAVLFLRVWGQDADVDGGNLDSYIHFLRQRIEGAGSRCSIKTLRGVGYILEIS